MKYDNRVSVLVQLPSCLQNANLSCKITDDGISLQIRFKWPYVFSDPQTIHRKSMHPTNTGNISSITSPAVETKSSSATHQQHLIQEEFEIGDSNMAYYFPQIVSYREKFKF